MPIGRSFHQWQKSAVGLHHQRQGSLSLYQLYIFFTIHTFIYSTTDMCVECWFIHLIRQISMGILGGFSVTPYTTTPSLSVFSFSLFSLLVFLLKMFLHIDQRYMKIKMDTYRYRYLFVVVSVRVSLYCLSVYLIVQSAIEMKAAD